MIVAYRPPAEGAPWIEGVATVELTDSQRAWIIHCVKSTPGPRAREAEELAVECLRSLGGQL
jgi:hypothetical protein